MESKQEEKFVLKQAEEDLKKKQEEQQAKQAERQPAREEAKAEAKAEPEEKKKAEKPPKEKGEAAEKGEKKREIVLERLYIIPIKRFTGKKTEGARFKDNARKVRIFAAKHLKTDLKKIKIDNRVATFLSRGGKRNLIKKIKVKTSKDKEGVVLVELA